MRAASTLVLIAAAAALGGCASTPESGATSRVTATAATPTSSTPKELGVITDSGFGQSEEYVWAGAVVHNNTDKVGQTVTVTFNALDASGAILKTESQVESFSAPSADHYVGTQLTLEKGQKAAKVEASLDVEDSGTFSDQPFPTMPTSKATVSKNEYGGTTASYTLTNPLTVAVKSPRIAVLCRDAAKKIIGGGIDLPDVVPAGGTIKVDTDVTTTGTPASCAPFVGAPADWEGAPATQTPEPSAKAPTTTADAAFKVWVENFGKGAWKTQYATLLDAQKAVVSEREYIACRTAKKGPAIRWVKTLSVTDAPRTTVPGTKLTLPATKVRAQVSAGGMKAPVDAHMFLEDGIWKWSMTAENIANCAK